MFCLFCDLSEVVRGVCPRCGTSHPGPATDEMERILKAFGKLSTHAQRQRDEAEARRQRIMARLRL